MARGELTQLSWRIWFHRKKQKRLTFNAKSEPDNIVEANLLSDESGSNSLIYTHTPSSAGRVMLLTVKSNVRDLSIEPVHVYSHKNVRHSQ